MKELLDQVVAIAKTAGEKILTIREKGYDVELKSDQSPVTLADTTSSDIILSGLEKLESNLPVICEETVDADYSVRKHWQRYWLVDPLDGTKSFVSGTDDFAVLIALIENNKPVLGVVHAPAKNLTYKAAKDIGAFKIEQDKEALPIHCRPYSSINKPAVVVSLDHATASVSNYLSQVGDHDLVRMGSALKMCLVADGSADVYPRLGKTGEWDSGAGQVIVECAGGIVIDEQGNPLRYNTKESVINPNFIVIGDTSVDWLQYLTHSNSRDAAKAS